MNIFLFLIKEEGEFKHSLKRTCNFAGIIHSDGTLALNTSALESPLLAKPRLVFRSPTSPVPPFS